MSFTVNNVIVTEKEVLSSSYNYGEPNATKTISRIVRDKLLAETDWWAVQDRTMSDEEYNYRQALRDIPQQEGFPTNVVWPEKPL